MFIIAHFLWVGSPGMAWLTSLLKDSQSSNQGVGQTALSSGGTNGEEPVSKVTQIGRIQCLVAVRWRAPASSFHPSLLEAACSFLPCGLSQDGHLLQQISKSLYSNFASTMESYLMQCNHRGTSHPLYQMLLARSKSQVSPQGESNSSRMDYSKVLL